MEWETKDQIAFDFMDTGMRLLLRRGFITATMYDSFLKELDINIQKKKIEVRE